MYHASKLFINLNAKKLFILRKAMKMMREVFRGKSIFPKKNCVYMNNILHTLIKTQDEIDGWMDE